MIFESTEDDAEIVKLFSLSEFSTEKSKDTIYQLPVYVESALLGMDKWGKEYKEFITTPLIFIYSDPTSGDGDGDGISDPEDIMPLVTLNYKSTKFSEFVDTAEFFEIRFILECQLMKGYTADECVDCIEILRKYKDTNDVASFQQEMISAGLVSPDAAAPVTWFDKIFWGAWAENESAPLLNEYEDYAQNTSFEELFEKSWDEWSDTSKTFLNIMIFSLADRLNPYDSMGNIKYKPMTKKEINKLVFDTAKKYKGKIKNNPLRIEYENEVRKLSDYKILLEQQGLSKRDIAYEMWKARRELGVKYKNMTPTLLREYIYCVNTRRYQDPLGASFEYFESYKTYDEIINSSMKPNDNVDKLLGDFEEWLLSKWE